jgi:lysozyme family protein
MTTTRTRGFDDAVELIIALEGGLVDDPKDPGGVTKYGISARANPGVDIRSLTVPQAKEIYRKKYWEPLGLDQLPWPVALVVFDTAVHSGPGRAVRLLQRSVGARADGSLGPMTRAAVLRQPSGAVVSEYTARRTTFLSRLKTWPRYRLGWLRRVFRVVCSSRGGSSSVA